MRASNGQEPNPQPVLEHRVLQDCDHYTCDCLGRTEGKNVLI